MSVRSTSKQSQIPALCVGVLRLTKERHYIRRDEDNASYEERSRATHSPWEMHSSWSKRPRARRPNARIIVLEYSLIATSYGILVRNAISTLSLEFTTYFRDRVGSRWDGNFLR